MTKRKSLITAIVFMAAAIIFFMLLRGCAEGQEVTVNIGVVEGSIWEKTNFSSLTKIGDSYYKDSYQSKLRATQANMTLNKTFNGTGVTTNFSGVSDAYISEKEVIGTTQIYDTSCIAVAAGSKFVGSAIEYKGTSSPGGIGACAGVNFSADVPQSIGRLSAASIYKRIGETTISAEEEGGEDIVVFEDTLHKSEVTVSGNQNDFVFTTESAVCNPADEPPSEPFFKFTLCADQPNGLSPWSITP